MTVREAENSLPHSWFYTRRDRRLIIKLMKFHEKFNAGSQIFRFLDDDGRRNACEWGRRLVETELWDRYKIRTRESAGWGDIADFSVSATFEFPEFP